MVTGVHGEVMVTAANIVEEVFKSVSDIVIIPPQLMAGEGAMDMERWFEHAILMDAEVMFSFLVR